MSAKATILCIQCLTYVALGSVMLRTGQLKLGLAQFTLAVVQFLVFSS